MGSTTMKYTTTQIIKNVRHCRDTPTLSTLDPLTKFKRALEDTLSSVSSWPATDSALRLLSALPHDYRRVDVTLFPSSPETALHIKNIDSHNRAVIVLLSTAPQINSMSKLLSLQGHTASGHQGTHLVYEVTNEKCRVVNGEVQVSEFLTAIDCCYKRRDDVCYESLDHCRECCAHHNGNC